MNSNMLPGLSSVGFWDCRGVQDWGLDFHRNEGLEIVYLETGGTGFEVDGRVHALHAGHLTVTRPWQLHRLGDPNIGVGRLFWLILDVGARRIDDDWHWPDWVVMEQRDRLDLTRKLRHGTRSVWLANGRVREVFREIGDCVTGWGHGRVASRLTVAINRLLVELLALVDGAVVAGASRPEGRRGVVATFLRALAADPRGCAEPWTAESLARCCGMGVTAMSAYCRELVNNGPMAYLNLCRLDHAARALRERPGATVTEIALAAGFNSGQYFATCFRGRFHMSPAEYRRREGC